MDRKDKTRRVRKRRKNKKFVTHQQLDKRLDDAIEDKFFDISRDGVPISGSLAVDANNVVLLTPVQEGVGARQTIGLKIKPKSLTLRIMYTGIQTANNDDESTMIRLMLIQWYLDAKVPPTLPDIIDFVSTGNVGNAPPLAYYNLENLDKFTVYYNKHIQLNNRHNATGFKDQDSHYISFPKRVRNVMYEADPIPPDINVPTTGHFYLLIFSDKDVVADKPFTSWIARLRYEDA